MLHLMASPKRAQGNIRTVDPDTGGLMNKKAGRFFLYLSTLALLVSSGCSGPALRGSWWDQLVPDSPCYRVDLSDGISEETTDELRDLYDCVNQGNLEPLRVIVDSMDQPSRTGDPLGLDLAAVYNHLPETGFGLVFLLDAAVGLLDSPEDPLIRLAELSVELIYAESYASVSQAGPSTNPEDLKEGVLQPALELLNPLSTAILDNDMTLFPLVADAVEGQISHDILYAARAAASTDSGLLADFTTRFPSLLGDALERSTDISNDHWSLASGNSIRDFVQVLVSSTSDGSTILETAIQPLWKILSDSVVLSGTEELLRESYISGSLASVPSQLLILADEDIYGDHLDPEDDSALQSLIRLLETANQQVSCSVTVFGIEIIQVDISDNLSVWLLEILAQQDPDTISQGLELAGTTLEWTLFLDMLETLAGACNLDESQLVADIPSLARLVDPEVGDLLVFLLNYLQVLHPSDDVNLIPELVELLSVVETLGLTQPLEELIRDLADGRLVSLLLNTLPVLLDPWSQESWCADSADSCNDEIWVGYPDDAFPASASPPDMASLVDLVGELLTPDLTELTPLESLMPYLQIVADNASTWQAVENLGDLLNQSDAKILDSPDVLVALMELDPDLETLETMAILLRDDDLMLPIMRMTENESLAEAIAFTDTTQEGPLPFASRLVIDGTLSSLLLTIELVLQLLEEV